MEYSDILDNICRSMHDFTCKYGIMPNAIMINHQILRFLMGFVKFQEICSRNNEGIITIMGCKVYETIDMNVLIKVMLM